MPQVALMKTMSGLVPYTQADQDYINSVKLGGIIQAKFTQARNPKFHRKFMALLNLAFDHFEPQPIELNGVQVTPEKNFDEFRRWVTVRAGFYDVVGYPDGGYRARAKSISFENMEEHEFAQLYSKSIDVLLGKILSDYESYDQVESTVNQIIGFA